MARGLAGAGALSPTDITVADPSERALSRFSGTGINAVKDNIQAVKGADIVAVAVKPWLAEAVISQIGPALDYGRQALVSVCAGIQSGQLRAWLDRGDGALPQLFMAIPNIAIEVGSCVSFVVPVNASEEGLERVTSLFSMAGSCIVTEERLLGAATSVASCGIAYALRYVRAAIEGGIELGMGEEDARKAVLWTVKGAAELLLKGGGHPESLIDRVTTPGGLTIRGLNEMEHAGFTSAVIRGLKAGAGR